jgi:hypothetical protein
MERDIVLGENQRSSEEQNAAGKHYESGDDARHLLSLR